MENPSKMDDFGATTIFGNTQMEGITVSVSPTPQRTFVSFVFEPCQEGNYFIDDTDTVDGHWWAS